MPASCSIGAPRTIVAAAPTHNKPRLSADSTSPLLLSLSMCVGRLASAPPSAHSPVYA